MPRPNRLSIVVVLVQIVTFVATASTALAQAKPPAASRGASPAPSTRPAAASGEADDSDKAIFSLRTEKDLSTYVQLIDKAIENSVTAAEKRKAQLDQQRGQVVASFEVRKKALDAARAKAAEAEKKRSDVELELAAATRDYQTKAIDGHKDQVDQQLAALTRSLELRKEYAKNVFQLVKKLAEAQRSPAGQ